MTEDLSTAPSAAPETCSCGITCVIWQHGRADCDDLVGFATMPPHERDSSNALSAVAAVVTILLVSDDEASSTAHAPQTTDRAEFIQRYREINPVDRDVTAQQFGGSAQLICNTLREGYTADEVIEIYAWNWKSNTAEIVRLHVAYGCPDYLNGFK